MQHNALLNNVLIVMCRSLLQYAGDTWPSVDSERNGTLSVIHELIAQQHGRIQKLVELLDARRGAIDFGSYPDYSDLHYLALSALVPHLIENERLVIVEIESARAESTDDAEGEALLGELLEGERALRVRLEELSRTQGPKPVA